MKVLPPTFFRGALKAGVPQKVKNITTFIPMAAAPVAMIMAARCLSRPPDITIIVSLFSAPGMSATFDFSSAIALSTSTLIFSLLSDGRFERPMFPCGTPRDR